MKIFFYTLREYDELPCAEQLTRETGIEFGYTDVYPDKENYTLARGADAVCMTPCDMSAPMLERFASIGVKYILCRSIGYDHVDLAKAKELGMRVSNTSYPPSGVANYALLLMLMMQRKILPTLKRAELQDYSLKGKIGDDIAYQTVGVIGTGRIGRTLIRSLSGMGCRIVCYDPYKNEEVKTMAEYVSLDELFRVADVISLHTNATEENHHLLNAEAFAKMKDGVLIVNTARGKLIDTEALIHALESGKVGGAALDVLEHEDGLYYYNRVGDVIDNQEMALLRSFPNVILSPHTAFYTRQAVNHMVQSCYEAAEAFAEGKSTVHEVTLP
jgi:lactate dehydrogenase-like 2-hydroxyacid dehydrogenase